MRKKIRQIIEFYESGIWQVSPNDVGKLYFLLLEIAKKVILAVRFFTTKRVVSEAAALTLSLIHI